MKEGKVVFDDHDADDPDFVKLIKKHGLKAKSDGDDTTVTGSPDKIEKVLQTIYGNDWKDMYTRKGQNFENFAGKEVGLDEKSRQLKDPKKEIMVVKNGKVEVIDKKDKEKYMKKGYDLAEGKKYEHGIGKVNSAFEIGTPEYRQHTQSITPGQEITDYQQFKVQSMKEALAKVWGLDESKKEEKDLTKKVKGSTMTMTGKKSDEIDTKPEIDKEK
tara:strand:- start:107 stop:754 length:648 start_codon:yes stop_codon:yes gene_type:complete